MSLQTLEGIKTSSPINIERTEFWEHRGNILDADLAERAGKVVVELMKRPQLSFVYPYKLDRYVASLGIWEPRQANDWSTIRAHPVILKYVKPLIEAIDTTIGDDELLANCPRATVRVLPPSASIVAHQDIAKGRSVKKRRVVNLAGNSAVSCSASSTRKSESFYLGPGDCYDLFITDDSNTSPEHSVEAIGESPRVSLMFTEETMQDWSKF